VFIAQSTLLPTTRMSSIVPFSSTSAPYTPTHDAANAQWKKCVFSTLVQYIICGKYIIINCSINFHCKL